jgi:hypothetical protein
MGADRAGADRGPDEDGLSVGVRGRCMWPVQGGSMEGDVRLLRVKDGMPDDAAIFGWRLRACCVLGGGVLFQLPMSWWAMQSMLVRSRSKG